MLVDEHRDPPVERLRPHPLRQQPGPRSHTSRRVGAIATCGASMPCMRSRSRDVKAERQEAEHVATQVAPVACVSHDHDQIRGNDRVGSNILDRSLQRPELLASPPPQGFPGTADLLSIAPRRQMYPSAIRPPNGSCSQFSSVPGCRDTPLLRTGKPVASQGSRRVGSDPERPGARAAARNSCRL